MLVNAGRGAQAFGIFLIVLMLDDLFFTVLFPGANHGLVRMLINRVGWRVFATISQLVGKYRHAVLSFAGPVLITAHIVVWVVLFIAGYGLVYWPVLGNAIHGISGINASSFIAAVYYSGFDFTTLGTGGIVPLTGPYRLLTITEAVLGFSTITLVLTYFQSVYSAIVGRNAFVLGLHSSTARTGSPAELLVGIGPAGDFSTATVALSRMGSDLLHVFESHRAYPILRYFHFPSGYKSLPYMLFVMLDTAALIRSALDPSQYRSVIESSATTQVWEGGLHEIDELLATLIPRRLYNETKRSDSEREAWWADHYRQARTRLEEAGISTEPDVEHGTRRYIELRRHYDAQIVALTRYLRYPLADVFQTLSDAEGRKHQRNEQTLSAR